MLKERLNNIKKGIKNMNIVKLLKSKAIIKELENKIGELGKEKQDLIDKNRALNLEIRKYNRQDKKIVEYKKDIQELDSLLEDATKETDLLRKAKLELESKIFELNQEVARYKIQCEEYEQQINDYRTEGRYIVKRLKPGKTPNTIKTRVSKPMSGNVVAYMRGEHE